MNVLPAFRLCSKHWLAAACVLGLATLLCATATPAQTITAPQAKDHVGQTATVCGKVVSTRYASSRRGQPTFLNLDKPYPNQVFTVVIWGADRAKFGTPEDAYTDKDICVSGKIKAYQGVPEIIASDPKQIEAKSEESK